MNQAKFDFDSRCFDSEKMSQAHFDFDSTQAESRIILAPPSKNHWFSLVLSGEEEGAAST